MKTLEHKLIIYDSNCKVCSSLRKVVLKFTTIPEEKIAAWKDLSISLSAQVDPQEFKNGMALIDTAGRDTIYGAEGIAYIFSSQYRIADMLLRFKPFFSVFAFLYKTQAYNRYIMATPKSNFQCDCFPDKVIEYRLSYIALTYFIAFVLTALFGMSLSKFVNHLSPWDAAAQMLLMAGTGWIIQLLIAIALMKEKALDYAGHLGSIMVVGLLILTPWMIFYSLTGMLIFYLPLISVLMSSGYMLYLHITRIRYVMLSQTWTVSWFLLLQTTALGWIYFFYFKISLWIC